MDLKRRNFLAGGLLALFGADAVAAKKKAAKTGGKPAAKGAAKHVAKGKPGAKPAHGSGRAPARGRHHVAPPPVQTGPTVHTAEESVVEKPPVGSSASRLPPVKAPEPPLDWRTYEITTSVSLPRSGERVRLWLPLPLNQDTLYQRTLGHSWSGNTDSASMRRLPDGNLEVYFSEWRSGVAPQVQLTTTVTTSDRHFDITKRTVAPEREDILRRNLQASQLIPNDDEAHALGERIVGRIKDPVAQAKAIYDWVIDNAIYSPDIRGVGGGDVRRQLDERQYGGRSADINGLFVSLCRGIGIPARCVYGLRVGSSRLFRSLGLVDDKATSAQHVRAEFYVPGYGWIPVDPSDVRRAIALEGISERDSKLAALRRVLFGVWEMNWIAYNFGSDVVLPGTDKVTPFVIQPRFEGDNNAATPYTITVKRQDS